jgi:hypothetical protein
MCKVRAATWAEAICKMPFWQITIDQKSRVVFGVFQSWNTYWGRVNTVDLLTKFCLKG